MSDFPSDELAARRQRQSEALRLARLGRVSNEGADRMWARLRQMRTDEMGNFLDEMVAPLTWRERLAWWWADWRARRRRWNHLKLMKPARGKALDMMGRCYALSRVGILERVPFVGDRWFRRRVEAAMKHRLGTGVEEVRLSAGYESELPQ